MFWFLYTTTHSMFCSASLRWRKTTIEKEIGCSITQWFPQVINYGISFLLFKCVGELGII